jgi:quercetin dioxygenase-like cupin family protein
MRIAAIASAVVLAAAALGGDQAPAQAPAAAPEMGVVRQFADNAFAPCPGLPACMLGAVQSGDPGTGASLIAFKAPAGCVIPWHWHTPNEHLMLVSGTAKAEMKGGSSVVLQAGAYARFPSTHVHQFSCPTACQGFVGSDKAFDIHYVDAAGKEIAPEAALGLKR